MGGNTREAGRSSASRLLALLAAFTDERPAQTLSELADHAGLPIPTAHRLAGELTAWGALERADDGRFRVGMRLWRVGTLAPAQRTLREVALPFMGDLHGATGENAQLAVREGLRALYLEKVSGRQSVVIPSEVGARLPMHATAVGKVLLAHGGPELLEAVVADGLERCTPHTITQPGLLARSLEQVRTDGVAFALEEMGLGGCSVAAPITAPDTTVVASLAVVVRSTTDLKPLVAAVRTAASGVSRQLGRVMATGERPERAQRTG